ncbi:MULTISPECIES: PHP domain-containing protein [Micrococcaceae]|uniref:PHP domain-containing protein n=2 Tax=Micrococcales TaxID=85006 RepID=UPI0015E3CC04|nr:MULTISPECIES: PHP domain-containing protein [Micrococcaceae]
MAFTHPHVHSEMRSLDGLRRDEAGPKRATALGQEAMAITDHADLTGAYAFRKASLHEGIRPIIGVEFYLAIGSRSEKNSETVANDDDNATDADDGKEKSKKYMHLTVVARNETGWKNLLALHNKAEDYFRYKPRIDFDLIKKHREGLTILTGCLGGPVAGPLSRAGATEKRGDAQTAELFRTEARKNLDILIDAVGREHVFLEVMYHGIGAEVHAFREIRALSEETGIPLVATNDCHYEHQEDAHAYDAFLAVVKKTLDDPERFSSNGTPDYYIKSEDEMLAVLGNPKMKPQLPHGERHVPTPSWSLIRLLIGPFLTTGSASPISRSRRVKALRKNSCISWLKMEQKTAVTGASLKRSEIVCASG